MQSEKRQLGTQLVSAALLSGARGFLCCEITNGGGEKGAAWREIASTSAWMEDRERAEQRMCHETVVRVRPEGHLRMAGGGINAREKVRSFGVRERTGSAKGSPMGGQGRGQFLCVL